MATSKNLVALLFCVLLVSLCALAAPIGGEAATQVIDRRVKAKSAPAKAAPVKIAPVKAAPVKVSPVKAAPVKAAPVKAAPVKIAPAKAAPVKVAPVKAAPVKVAPVKAAPVKAAPAKAAPVAPVKAAPVKATPAPVKATPITSTSAQSCPIRKPASKALPRGVQTPRNVTKRALTGTGEHTVSLVRSNIGTEHEHWALFFHPSQANADGTFTGTLVDAVINDENKPDAKLVVDVNEDRTRGSRNIPGRQDTVTAIGTVASGAEAQALVDLAKNVRITQKPPTFNCVDFTNSAISAISGRSTRTTKLTSADAAVFTTIFNANKDAVRDKTACNFACRTPDEEP